MTFKDDDTKGNVVLKSFKAGIAENVTPQKTYATVVGSNLTSMKEKFIKFFK